MSQPDFDWATLRETLVHDCGVFELSKYERANSRKKGEFYVLSGNDWVNIIPVTPNREIVMIEQFRHGTEDITLEIPGGLVDDSDPDPRTAAIREMMEETGYTSDDVEHLGTIAPNPAIQSNRCHSFLANGAALTQRPETDELEEIRTRLVPAEEIPDLIRTGKITHALVVVAFAYYALRSAAEGFSFH